MHFQTQFDAGKATSLLACLPGPDQGRQPHYLLRKVSFSLLSISWLSASSKSTVMWSVASPQLALVTRCAGISLLSACSMYKSPVHSLDWSFALFVCCVDHTLLVRCVNCVLIVRCAGRSLVAATNGCAAITSSHLYVSPHLLVLEAK